jgi:NTE family protein
VPEWPGSPLRIVAVEQTTGRRRTFDAGSGVDLVDAVTASCAVPGVWPPVEIAGERYVDGGAWSSTNADLAGGAERVVVLVPSALPPATLALLAEEQDSLAPASCLVVSVDEKSLAAIGPNALDPARRPLAYQAGRRQAATEAAALRAFWV